MARYAIKDIAPNPFRHLERYPIRREKVDALKESIRTTGFWDNLVARKDGNGKPQIAYGHHRLVALKEELGPSGEIELNIRRLDDEHMVQIMARENLEEWGTVSSVEHETVRSVVEGFAAGHWDLGEIDPSTKNTQRRYAPGFTQGDVARGGGSRPYTGIQVAAFLGWGLNKVQNALNALELIEEGILKETAFDGLGSKDAEAVLRQANKVKREYEAAAKQREKEAQEAARAEAEAETEREATAARKRKEKAEAEAKRLAAEGQEVAGKVGEAVSDALQSGAIGTAGAAEVALAVTGPKEKETPDIAKYMKSLSGQIAKIPGGKMAEGLDLVIKFRSAAPERELDRLINALLATSNRFARYAERLQKPTRKGVSRKALTAGRKGR